MSSANDAGVKNLNHAGDARRDSRAKIFVHLLVTRSYIYMIDLDDLTLAEVATTSDRVEVSLKKSAGEKSSHAGTGDTPKRNSFTG